MAGKLYLTSPKLKVTKIKKKTTSNIFKDLKYGDIFQLRVEVKHWGRGDHGAHASYFEISVNGGEFVSTKHTFNTVSNYLECFRTRRV